MRCWAQKMRASHVLHLTLRTMRKGRRGASPPGPCAGMPACGKTVNTGVLLFLIVVSLLTFGAAGFLYFIVAEMTAKKVDDVKEWNAPRAPPASPYSPPPPPTAPARRLSEKFRTVPPRFAVATKAERVLTDERSARR